MSDQTRASLGWTVWRWWILASLLGVTLGYAIGSPILLPVIAVLTIGISIAVIQLLILWHPIPNAGWWVLASSVGLAWGAIIGALLNSIGWGTAVIVLGASLGMMQWLSLITRSKRWRGVAISLPIIALLGWVLYEQVLVWATPVPRWLVSKEGQYFGSCWIAPQLTTFDFEVKPVEEVQTAKISREQAQRIAERVVARQYGSHSSAYNAQLVQMTLPDGRQRLAWYHFVLIKLNETAMEAKAAGVFVDALTGEPLMLATDMVVGDPCMVCECATATFPLSSMQTFALLLLVAYLLVLAIAVWLGGLVREAKKRTRQPSG